MNSFFSFFLRKKRCMCVSNFAHHFLFFFFSSSMSGKRKYFKVVEDIRRSIHVSSSIVSRMALEKLHLRAWSAFTLLLCVTHSSVKDKEVWEVSLARGEIWTSIRLIFEQMHVDRFEVNRSILTPCCFKSELNTMNSFFSSSSRRLLLFKSILNITFILLE